MLGLLWLRHPDWQAIGATRRNEWQANGLPYGKRYGDARMLGLLWLRHPDWQAIGATRRRSLPRRTGTEGDADGRQMACPTNGEEVVISSFRGTATPFSDEAQGRASRTLGTESRENPTPDGVV
ncbi:hypothetical protein Pan216_18630 [Planctomycetes bacterium Pan216]|uniref:Uncharacterized protein n=1 Tax=Kolteria novifilia TaxID=2527975 RepID=A0A518B1Z7_9BACT|nr:hypothetical protein Pan216_18630 [Planctomycetes bacterium Pan216]